MADNTRNAEIWQEAAAAGTSCLPLETLERFLDNAGAEPQAASHLAACPHCQAELTMLRNFVAATPAQGEGAAVAWISAELERRAQVAAGGVSATPVSFFRSLFSRPYLAGAVALGIVLAAGTSLYLSDRTVAPSLRQPDGSESYRAGDVRLLAPFGDLVQAPAEFRWQAYPGAANYKLELMEVDGTVLWSGSSDQPVLATPSEMKSHMRSGKRLRWKVTALDASGRTIAQSTGGELKIKP